MQTQVISERYEATPILLNLGKKNIKQHYVNTLPFERPDVAIKEEFQVIR